MIHYDLSGKGNGCLVFVHGLTCAGTDWNKQIEKFETQFRCLTVDLRGHGQSQSLCGPYDPDTLAADVVALLHDLDIERAILIGHSMGTRVITVAYMQAPERIKGLVFVDGSRQGEGDPLLAKQTATALFAESTAGREFLRGMFSAMFTERSDATERDAIVERALALPIERVSELMGNMSAWDAGRMPAVFGQIKVPMTVIQSTFVDSSRKRRTLTDNEETPYFAMIRNAIPHALISVIPGTGHFIQLDAPTEVNSAIALMAEQAFSA